MLCDLHMPGVSGLDITERLVKGKIGSRVIIVSVQVDGPMPRRLLDAGAFGYLGKCGDAAELLKAIREVARGRRYLGADIAQRWRWANAAARPSTCCRGARWRSRCCSARACAPRTSRAG